MQVNYYIKLILLCVLSFYLSSTPLYSFANEKLNLATDGSIIIKGEIFKGCMIAYDDFLKEIEKKYRNKSSDMAIYLSKIENYDVELDQDDTSYFISFYPRTSLKDKMIIKGGATKYTINKSDFKLIHKEYQR